MRTKLILLFLLIGLKGYADNYPRNESVDMKHYTFRLHLNDTTNVLTGEATLELKVRKPFLSFEVDLINKMNTGEGMSVSAVLLNEVPLTYTHENNRLKINLPVAPKTDEVISIVIRYAGIPKDGLIISKNKFGDRTFFGDNWPDRARHWLPCIDHPYDKAGVDFIVIAPLQYTVIGNGIRREESYINEQQKLTHWHEAMDIPTKVMVIGVARFAIQRTADDSIPVESWVYPQNKSEGFIDYAPAVTILDFFQKQIGPYPYKKLANVQSTTRYGGMENASNIFYYEASVTGKKEVDDLIAHEIAHQWFGNSASENDWHHIWLSESFATYFTHVYNEFTYGNKKLTDGLSQDRNQVIAYCKKSPGPVINPTITDYMLLLTPHVYQRGSWVLHMLRWKIGEEAFWKGIREYYRTYQNSNALTTDLQKIMEKNSGSDLTGFFKQWLERTEIPRVRTSWTYNTNSKNLELDIEQVQAGEAFELPLEISLEGSSFQKTETILITQKRQKILIPTAEKPGKIAVDPQVKLLFEDLSKK